MAPRRLPGDAGGRTASTAQHSPGHEDLGGRWGDAPRTAEDDKDARRSAPDPDGLDPVDPDGMAIRGDRAADSPGASGTLLQASCRPLVLGGVVASFRAEWNGPGETIELCNSADGPLHDDDVDQPVGGGESALLECFGENISVERLCSLRLHLWLELAQTQ
jgi:hypothetical protein